MIDNRLTIVEITELLQSLIVQHSPVVFDIETQTMAFDDSVGMHRTLSLPLVLPKLVGGSAEELLRIITAAPLNYTIILIQAGAAVIGCYNNGELMAHNVIKKYMVRKSQGTAQIKYLKSKGKSRLGSRIRLRNSRLFFNEINEKLTAADTIERSESILLFLPVNLMHPLFTADVPVPFEKHDPRVRKIPIDVNVPSFKELGHIHWLVSRGVLKRGTDTGSVESVN